MQVPDLSVLSVPDRLSEYTNWVLIWVTYREEDTWGSFTNELGPELGPVLVELGPEFPIWLSRTAKVGTVFMKLGPVPTFGPNSGPSCVIRHFNCVMPHVTTFPAVLTS